MFESVIVNLRRIPRYLFLPRLSQIFIEVTLKIFDFLLNSLIYIGKKINGICVHKSVLVGKSRTVRILSM